MAVTEVTFFSGFQPIQSELKQVGPTASNRRYCGNLRDTSITRADGRVRHVIKISRASLVLYWGLPFL